VRSLLPHLSFAYPASGRAVKGLTLTAPTTATFDIYKTRGATAHRKEVSQKPSQSKRLVAGHKADKEVKTNDRFAPGFETARPVHVRELSLTVVGN
jgi:hypothetical protein